ncbi:MAG TPA: hypothetical protein DCQ06_11715, partial [Myxococcales bacterium]|nr:hypothetical protein [Myxococcales bacterium]
MASPPTHIPSSSQSRRITVAVDTGGTFTDLVAQVHGAVVRIKTPSTPADPSVAVVAALTELRTRCDLTADDVIEVRHGTTVATNALLERAGARVVLITNAGFEDVIALGRQDRPDLYALHPQVSQALVAETDRVGIRVRRGPQGQA